MAKPGRRGVVGRPPEAEPLTVQVAVRLTPEERADYEARAAKDARRLSDWIRQTLRQATGRS